jgi:hypothetical protein
VVFVHSSKRQAATRGGESCSLFLVVVVVVVSRHGISTRAGPERSAVAMGGRAQLCLFATADKNFMDGMM